ncbi:MAG: TetR/AcrR family transcriptional regulator [Lachnospiraceae bacterium]|nr:TetR/AcrR family transcriptional regulator [Lachnospiraceae bacterium]
MEPKNVLRSKKLLKEAVQTLMVSKNASDIKVTEITALAEVNRGTFYAHYNTVYDVIGEIEDDLIDDFLGPLEGTLSNVEDYFFYVKKTLATFYERSTNHLVSETFKQNLSPRGITKLKERICKIIETHLPVEYTPEKQLEYRIRVSFLLSGYMGLLEDWSNGSLGDISSDTMYDYIHEFALKIVHSPEDAPY